MALSLCLDLFLIVGGVVLMVEGYKRFKGDL